MTLYVFQMDNFLHADVKDFLTECRPKLQNVFNSCKFHHVDACLAKLHEHTVETMAFLKGMARSLLGHEQQAYSAGHPEGRQSGFHIIPVKLSL